MTAFLLLAAVLCWLALPFLPAIHEALRPHDDGALPISERYQEDLRLATPDADDVPPQLPDGRSDADPARDLPLIVRHAYIGAVGQSADEIRVSGMARLRAGTTVRRRLQVGGSVEVDPGSVLRGSAEAGTHFWLGSDVTFERVHAPTIEVGVGSATLPDAVPAPFDFPVPDDADLRAGRALIRGDLTVPPGARLDITLVVTGTLALGPGAHVTGDVKAHGDVTLGHGAAVGGNLFAGNDLTLGDRATVTGAAVAEGVLTIGASACIGQPTAPTTATAREIQVASGARIHGTLWAETTGRTLSMTAAADAVA